jgi:hypothetical protein
MADVARQGKSLPMIDDVWEAMASECEALRLRTLTPLLPKHHQSPPAGLLPNPTRQRIMPKTQGRKTIKGYEVRKVREIGPTIWRVRLSS